MSMTYRKFREAVEHQNGASDLLLYPLWKQRKKIADSTYKVGFITAGIFVKM
jgi:hypothetical protein